jgi:hypothetical protein
MREAHLGHTHTPETKAKIAAAQSGRVFTPEHLANLRQSYIDNPPHKGHPHTEETKKLLSEQRFAIPIFAETKERMSIAQKARRTKDNKE